MTGRAGEPAAMAAALGGGGWESMQRRLAEIREATEPLDLEDTPEAGRRYSRERRAQVVRDVWAKTLARWPDDDFRGASMDALTGEQGAAAIMAWIQDPRARLLILTGAVGVGKSYAAFAVANHYVTRGWLCRAHKHQRYIDDLMPNRDEPADLVRERAQNAHLLLLDELSGGSGTPFTQRETCDLVSMRLAPRRRTVVTTNLNGAALKEVFDDRTLSRLRKDAVVVEVTGADRRTAAEPAPWFWGEGP